MNVQQYAAVEPKFEFETFFDGKIKGWGLLEDFGGKVTRRFDVWMEASRVGDEVVVKELFKFYDGEVTTRVWRVTVNADGTLVGRAGDILGLANGVASGNALQFVYAMKLPVGGGLWTFKFDDWMYALHDEVVVNRSYIKKFGVTLAELSLFMQKQPTAAQDWPDVDAYVAKYPPKEVK